MEPYACRVRSGACDAEEEETPIKHLQFEDDGGDDEEEDADEEGRMLAEVPEYSDDDGSDAGEIGGGCEGGAGGSESARADVASTVVGRRARRGPDAVSDSSNGYIMTHVAKSRMRDMTCNPWIKFRSARV